MRGRGIQGSPRRWPGRPCRSCSWGRARRALQSKNRFCVQSSQCTLVLTSLSGQAIICGGQVLSTHVDHGHHVVTGVEAGGLSLLGLSLGGNLDSLVESGGGLLTLDEHSLDLPLGGGGGDDEAEPEGEDDAEGDGGGSQPPGHPDLGVKTGDPVRPAPAIQVSL